MLLRNDPAGVPNKPFSLLRPDPSFWLYNLYGLLFLTCDMSSLKFQSPVPESVVPLPFRHVLFYLPLQHAPSDIPQYGYLTYMFLSNSLKAFHPYHPQYT